MVMMWMHQQFLICQLVHVVRNNTQRKLSHLVVLVAVAAIIGWQIHVNVIENNNNQSTQKSLNINYIEQFLHDSLSNHTLHKYLPLWKNNY